MFRSKLFCLYACAMAAICFSGCGTRPVSDNATPRAVDTPALSDKQEAEIAAALAEFTPEDRKAAEQQRICPLSDKRLGTMGPPPKIKLKGQEIFLCCAGCEDDVRKDPDRFLAKVKK